jgi:acyl carrier protein
MNETDIAPLHHFGESEIEVQLRGYPDPTITAAKALRTASSTSDIEKFLLALLSFFLPAGSSPLALSPRSDLLLREELGLDSLALSEAMFKIEELFDIRVENSELAELKTLADARHLLTDKLAASHA